MFIQLKKIPLCTVGELIRAASRRSLGISSAGGSYLPIQSADIVWTGQCCYSWSFTAEIMHNTNTLNFYLHSICTHAWEFLDFVVQYDVCASWLQLFLPALSLWREIELSGPSLLCAPLRLVKSNDLSSSCEKTSEMRHPLVSSSLSSPAVPLIIVQF